MWTQLKCINPLNVLVSISTESKCDGVAVREVARELKRCFFLLLDSVDDPFITGSKSKQTGLEGVPKRQRR